MDKERNFGASDDRVNEDANRGAKPASSKDWEAAPLSTALGIPTLIGETPASSSKPEPETTASPADKTSAQDEPTPFSASLGIPTLITPKREPEATGAETDRAQAESSTASSRVDPAAPFSAALGIPTLIDDAKRPSADQGSVGRMSEEPAPVSKALGIPTLINETPKEEAAENEDLESRRRRAERVDAAR